MEITAEELSKLLDEQYKRGYETGKDQATCEYNGHAFVDLGLLSGTLWATCNVGATRPEEYGDYFAWGETKPKTEYVEENYAYADKPKPNVLPESEDAATANWGKGWRMPTNEDFEELINRCSWKYIKQNNVFGCLFTGPNGHSIFLPNAGTISEESGSDGSYWSSCCENEKEPDFLEFNDGGCMVRDYDYLGDDHCGQLVRPVCSIKK